MLDQLYFWAKAENKSLAVYAVNLQDPEATIQALLKQVKLGMPILRDVDGKVAKAYGIGVIPHTTIIADGLVKAVHTGVPPTPEARLQWLENLQKDIQGYLDVPKPSTIKP